MKGGDLSNTVAPGVGVLFEHVVHNFSTGKVNIPGRAFLESLVALHNCNVYLITLMDKRKVMAFCFKYAVPYTNILQLDSALEIPEVVQAHHLLAYYDTDERVLEAVRSRGNPRTDAIQWTQPAE